MKTPPLAALGLALLTSQTHSCTPLANVQITFFGYPDNSPPGAGIAFTTCGHSLAGGTGSYSDPITFATAPDGDFRVCEVVYLPHVRKYARYEDDCEQCNPKFAAHDWDSSRTYHIDLWTGSTSTNGGDAQIACEDSLPGGPQTILRNPPADLPTDTTPFFSPEDGDCYRRTYDDGASGCSGGASSKAATTLVTSTTKKAPAPTTTKKAPASTTTTTATACAWEGHCAGAPCETYNDCADPFVCTGGKCADA
ncbi:MAG: hypothetical protein Q9195_006100 [Heterodermia aff. obscurata]